MSVLERGGQEAGKMLVDGEWLTRAEVIHKVRKATVAQNDARRAEQRGEQ